MKEKSKTIVSIGGIIIFLVISASLVFFYQASNKQDEAPRNSVEWTFATGDEPRPEYLNHIDRLLDTMEFDDIIINSPTKMNVDDNAKIQVLLRLTDSVEVLKLAIENEALKVGATVNVNNRMEVRLSGDQFKILARTAAEQTVSKHQRTEWKWEIQPKEQGKHELHISIIALFEIEGKNTSRTIRTFDKMIEVTVTE